MKVSVSIIFRRKVLGSKSTKFTVFAPANCFLRLKFTKIAPDFVREKLKFELSGKQVFVRSAMSDTLAATCRSGCALCEQITLRLGGNKGVTSFKLLLGDAGRLPISIRYHGLARQKWCLASRVQGGQG